MLPRLQAEESFHAAERIAVGTGSLAHPGAVMRRWKEASGAAGRPAAAVKATPQALGQLGIGVRRVARKPAQTSAQVIS